MAQLKYTPRRTYTPKTPAGKLRPKKRKTIKEKRAVVKPPIEPTIKPVVIKPYPGRGRTIPLTAIKIPEDVRARRKIPVVTPREEKYIRTIPTRSEDIKFRPYVKKTPKKPTFVERFVKPKDISAAALAKKKMKVQEWQTKDFPKWVTEFLGDPAKLSERDRKIVLPFYGKTSADALKQKQAMTYFSNAVYKDVKTNPVKAAFFFMIGKYSNIGGKVLQAKAVKKLLKRIPQGELIAKRTLQAISYALGVTYTINIYDRVTEPVLTGYKDGKTTTKERKLPNGDIEITATTKQIPQYRKPTGLEQHTRMGGIFATELLPLHLGIKAVDRGVKSGYKPEPKPKPKVKKTTRIKRAGKIISTVILLSVLPAPKLKLKAKPKAKPKAEPKVKTVVKPKVKTISLLKDPVAMKRLKSVQVAMKKVNLVASAKTIYRTQIKTAAKAKLQQNDQRLRAKQALINSNIAKRQKEIQKTIDLISRQQAKGKSVLLLKSRLLKLKKEAIGKQLEEIDALLRIMDSNIGYVVKNRYITFQVLRGKSLTMTNRKLITSASSKQKMLSKLNAISTSQSALKSAMCVYALTLQKPQQKQRIRVSIKNISTQIAETRAIIKEVTGIKVTPVLKVPTKKIPTAKRPVRKTPPRRPVKKPVMPPIIAPIIPPILPKRKAKAIKKKKKTSAAYNSWFVTNQIPTLKSLYG